MTLWQAITALAQQIPFSKNKVETLLSTQLSETANPQANDAYFLYESTPISIADGVIVQNVDLRIKRVGQHPGFLVLEIGGTCITLDQIRARYADLEITDAPRGRSPNDVTSHTTVQPWGELSFSFKESSPECLASIAFEPRKAK
jgi:hypothetical protein